MSTKSKHEILSIHYNMANLESRLEALEKKKETPKPTPKPLTKRLWFRILLGILFFPITLGVFAVPAIWSVLDIVWGE